MTDDFSIYRVSILNDIKRLGENLIKLQEATMSLTLAIENLKATDKIRSALWGSTGGLISATLIVLLVRMLWGDMLVTK